MTLADKFVKALSEGGTVAPNDYLTPLFNAVKSVDQASQNNAELAKYVVKLREIVERPDFALRGNDTNDFVQLLGEAHFQQLCLEKGLTLQRIPEGPKKTPDFKCHTNGIDVHFEVKTLSVVDGEHGIKAALQNSLEAQVEIERQQNAGKKLAVAEHVVQPYGIKPYALGRLTAVIDTLIEKARNNIKLEQFANPKTFLVVNLCLLPPSLTDNLILRPAYHDDYLFSKAVTGDLWMMAFAKPGMLIHYCPEFEGKPCIEGRITKNGILADPEFDSIAGMLFIIHPLRKKSEIWGLVREKDCDAHDLMDVVVTITGNNWNDDKDTNGWDLKGA